RSDRDWSSDVCSSDLVDVVEAAKPGGGSPRVPLEFIQNESLEGTELARRGNDVAAIVFPAALKRGEKTHVQFSYAGPVMSDAGRSEERRVGKEGRSWR